MCVNGCIAGSARQVLILTVRDVKMGLGVSVFFGEAEIDDIDLVATLANAHEEVVRFDIAMNERLGMNILDAGDKLVSQEEYGLQ